MKKDRLQESICIVEKNIPLICACQYAAVRAYTVPGLRSQLEGHGSNSCIIISGLTGGTAAD
jgi:hypothetical protein